MKTMEELLAERKALQAQLTEADHRIDARLAMTLVRCNHCASAYEIGELEYIQTHWYTQPHGCSGGDYWNQGEGQWKCLSCEGRNRLYNKPDITKLKRLFKTQVDEHKDR